MTIKLAEIGTLFQIGKRENMEDYIFPLQDSGNVNDRLFIVCDGMGGHAKGEIASKLACESFAEYISSQTLPAYSNEFFLNAFTYVQSVFDTYINNNPESHGMGTTLVLAMIHDKGISVMHCGDSRFYHLRNKEIKWMTSDHSLVNEWVQQGLITPEQAHGHPRSNVITRALQGSSAHKVVPDINLIEDIQTNDYIFLCTDGVVNSLTDRELAEIICDNTSTSTKIELISSICDQKSKDNYSAYLIHIGEIDD